MLRVGFFNKPELTGKVCSPSPDGLADWEMTEEDTKRKDEHVNECKSCSRDKQKKIFFSKLQLHNDPIKLTNDFSQ